MDQVEKILAVTGYPTPEEIESMRSPFAPKMLTAMPKSKAKPLAQVFPKASNNAVDMMSKCFAFNPNKRVTAKESLRHDYVVQFHNSDDEFDCDHAIHIPLDDNTKLKVQDYREQIYNEVLKKKKDKRRTDRRNFERLEEGVDPDLPHQRIEDDHNSQSQISSCGCGPAACVKTYHRPNHGTLPFQVQGVSSCSSMAQCSTPWAGKA
jgi:serine/threonine protein kinase